MIDLQYNISYRKKDKGIQFIISYKDATGKWKQKSKQGFKAKGEAKIAADKELDKLKKSIGQAVDINTEYDDITFKDFANMFLEHEKLYKEGNTLQRYITSMGGFRRLFDMKIVDITSLHVQNCIDEMIKRNLKVSTIKMYIVGGKSIFAYAVKLNILANSPMVNLQIPKDKEKHEKRALTIGELEDLLNKIKNKKYFMISMLAGKCGLRLGEILGLTWDDIDFENEMISINKQWKLLKNGTCGFGELKSINSNRKVHMSKSVIAELKQYKNTYTINKDRRLFNNKYTCSLASQLISIYRKKGYNISVHELRHTYATSLISKGLDYTTVASLMGHDVKQTMGTYSHVTKDMLERASKIIDDIF